MAVQRGLNKCKKLRKNNNIEDEVKKKTKVE
jgi:hypothetical protein